MFVYCVSSNLVDNAMEKISISLLIYPTNLLFGKILDMKKNQLQDCPDGIGALSRLKRLELDGK